MSLSVSIIIPTFNRSITIGKAIRSVLAQSVDNIEIIVVDDASSDNTEEVVRGFCDERIRYIKLSDNGGASRARNIGVSHSYGEYVAFLDSDDEWLMEMLEKHLGAFASNTACDAVVSGFIRYYRQSPEYISAPHGAATPGELMSAMLSRNFMSPQVLTLKRACFLSLGGFDETLKQREDWDFGLRLLGRFNVCTLDVPLAVVYETPGNLTSMTYGSVDTLRRLLRKHFQLFKTDRVALARHYYYIGHLEMLYGSRTSGRKDLINSVFACPNLKNFSALALSLFGGVFYRLVWGAINRQRGNTINNKAR